MYANNTQTEFEARDENVTALPKWTRQLSAYSFLNLIKIILILQRPNFRVIMN